MKGSLLVCSSPDHVLLVISQTILGFYNPTMQNQSPKALSKSWFYNLLANDGDVVGQ